MPTLTMFIQNGIKKPSYSNQTKNKKKFWISEKQIKNIKKQHFSG